MPRVYIADNRDTQRQSTMHIPVLLIGRWSIGNGRQYMGG